ncbi:hypothetical protein C2U70_25075 [Bradyrhizobium guangdongense]|uniref:hypothetical protein n=1 Tax=Bradyrhizobium guangdongense TaxID=1325090 RepID=UPI00112CD4AF|nr:hypothetical protein [Bradyrhizobium guangdongense]TPQ31064.1 hypothetical protein C2U70_25075 [Bradyrhizobium guangdongense]
MFRYFFAIASTIGVFSSQADAKSVSWKFTKKPIQLSGYPAGEDEPDYVLQMTCLPGAKVRVGVGPYKDIGKGHAGIFSVTLKSGDRSATLSGKSAKSTNWEMTVARELRTEMPLSSAKELLAVLTNGLPITASGVLKDSWTVNGLASQTAAFGESCSKN